MMTNYLKNKVQDYLFSGITFVTPTTYYIALSKTLPLADGTGVTEPTGGGYSRIAVSKGTTSFTTSVNGIVKNKITLLSTDATTAWGSIPYYGVYDSATGGNLLYGGTLAIVRNVDVEMQLVLEPNGITFGLN